MILSTMLRAGRFLPAWSSRVRLFELKKIRHEPFKGRVLFHTTYCEYFKQNVHVFEALDFLAERAPEGWKATHQHPAGGDDPGYEPLSDEDEEVGVNAGKRAWAWLPARTMRDPRFLLL